MFIKIHLQINYIIVNNIFPAIVIQIIVEKKSRYVPFAEADKVQNLKAQNPSLPLLNKKQQVISDNCLSNSLGRIKVSSQVKGTWK